MTEHKLSSGVQDLINRLHDKGIEEGKKSGENIVAEAHRHSKEIIDRAQQEADDILLQARYETERLHESARDAVQLAARDTMLDLKSALVNQFSQRVGEFVTDAVTDEDFLQQLIIEIAGTVKERVEGKNIEILLPANVVGLEELRKEPAKVKEGGLGQFVLTLSKDILRQGVTITATGSQQGGLVIKMVNEEVRIDFTDEVIIDLLLEHLLPRFRALLEGSIQ
jgi:V/A-type H+-transporting ATPase subunit E